MTVLVQPVHGDTVRWREAGTIVEGTVTFVGELALRVVPAGASTQSWQWIDVADLVTDEQIPGQLNMFATEQPCATFVADTGGAHPWCSTCGWQQPNHHGNGRDRQGNDA